jgi:hypothetical protein
VVILPVGKVEIGGVILPPSGRWRHISRW